MLLHIGRPDPATRGSAAHDAREQMTRTTRTTRDEHAHDWTHGMADVEPGLRLHYVVASD